MAKLTTITVHPDYRVAAIEKDLYGCFLEPIHNWVYGGIYNPKHPTADDMGFRTDMLEAVKELGVAAVRLPGGNFVSGWEWRDSIGPKEQRKAHLDFAWKQIEPNDVGHDEYLEWARRANAKAMYTLNCGTADINSNIECVEYSNHEGGTYWSELRKKNGYEKPHNVPIWYLGNEMDGPWQINSWSKNPVGYGVRCHETGKAVRWIDPKAKIGVCGACTPLLRTSPTWERQVFEQCYDIADYMSLHFYHGAPAGDYANLFAGTVKFEEFLNTELSVVDYVKAITNNPKKIMVSFDEYALNFIHEPSVPVYGREGHIPFETISEFRPENINRPFTKYDPDNFTWNPPRDPAIITALNLASVILMFLRRADRVKIGCMTAAIGDAIAYDRDHVWRTPVYFPYADLIKYGKGVSIMPAVHGPTFNSTGFHHSDFNQATPYENVPYIESAAAYDEENGLLTVFAINRNWEEDMPVSLKVPGFKGLEFVGHTQLYTDDLYAYNTYEKTNVAPTMGDGKLDGDEVSFTAKKLSWNMIQFKVK